MYFTNSIITIIYYYFISFLYSMGVFRLSTDVGLLIIVAYTVVLWYQTIEWMKLRNLALCPAFL